MKEKITLAHYLAEQGGYVGLIAREVLQEEQKDFEGGSV